MPFEIVRNDITNMKVDAIVNTANPKPVIGSGCDAGIHAKAGPELLEARKGIGEIKEGCAAITPAFGLDARYVIHTVGPLWQGGSCGEEETLRGCYKTSLMLALLHGCKSIAFPLISSGNYGFPRHLALKAAIDVFSSFLCKHDINVYLVVFDRDSFSLSEKLFESVSSYIDENYVLEKNIEQYGMDADCTAESLNSEMERRRRRLSERIKNGGSLPSPAAPQHKDISFSLDFHPEDAAEKLDFGAVPPCAASVIPDDELDLLLQQTDAGFSETLLGIIDRKKMKDSDVYKRANVDRKLFSKIRNNPDYRPSKPTSIAFAIALELSLDETRDLIGRAGYALTHSSKFDIIIEYFILHRNYNILEINAALFEFDQRLLGA